MTRVSRSEVLLTQTASASAVGSFPHEGGGNRPSVLLQIASNVRQRGHP